MKVQISKYNDEDSTQEIKVQIDPWDSWSCDYEGLNAYNARITRGTTLLGKYLRSLWS